MTTQAVDRPGVGTFAWVIYEATEGFEASRLELNKRLEVVREALAARGFKGQLDNVARFTEHGFVIWLRDGQPGLRPKASLEEAKRRALVYGASGWWRIDQLEAFEADPPASVVYELAMWHERYRRSLRFQGQWSKRLPNDQFPREWSASVWREISPEVFDRDFGDRLVDENGEHHFGRSWSISPGVDQMIYLSLDANVFGDLDDVASQLSRHCHLAIQQLGFTLACEGIRVLGTHEDTDQCYVEVTASYAEQVLKLVWPSTVTDRAKGDWLLEDLIRRLTAMSGF